MDGQEIYLLAELNGALKQAPPSCMHSNVGTSMAGRHTFASERKNRKLFRTKGVFLCGSCNS
jgi:hypothetical protein